MAQPKSSNPSKAEKMAKKMLTDLHSQNVFIQMYREKHPDTQMTDQEIANLGIQLSILNRTSGVISHLTFYTVVLVINLILGFIFVTSVANKL